MGNLITALIPGAAERRIETSTAANPADWLVRLLGASPTASGAVVTAETAIGVPAVYACIKVLAEGVSTLPFQVYRRLKPNGREHAAEHPLDELLDGVANPEMTSQELRENMVGHANLLGVAYAEIEWDGAGRQRGLWPLRPDKTRPARHPRGDFGYDVDMPDGSTVWLPAYRVWRVRAFGTDPYTGLSPIAEHRRTLGLAMVMEEYAERFFGNDSRPGGALKVAKGTSDKAKENMKRSWEAAFGGLSNKHRVAILEDGIEWQQIGLPNEDAQFLESRKLTRSEIAGIFRVPPHMIGDLERATFTNIAEQNRAFLQDSLLAWLIRFEKSGRRDLLTERERREYYLRHNVKGLLRGNVEQQTNFYVAMRQNGVYNADDIREWEDENPIPGGAGQVYMVNGNMVPIDETGRPASSQNGNAPRGEAEEVDDAE